MARIFCKYSDEVTGAAVIHNRDYRKYEQRFLPPMTQEQFINMWRTVYSFFALETNPEIFTSLSRVGTLLLQIGEVGRRVKETASRIQSQEMKPVKATETDNALTEEMTEKATLPGSSAGSDATLKSDSSSSFTAGASDGVPEADIRTVRPSILREIAEAMNECDNEIMCTGDKSPSKNSDSSSDSHTSCSSKNRFSLSQPSHSEWSISFEQFLANVANEERLIAFFERNICIAEEVQNLRKRQAVSTNGNMSTATTPS
ncbi:hypothetical protein SK128_002720 [Halocaridina rubra]|uniref:Uncharacterized protein n=1 Tax=Halocaridina rubra TaxID=373956 RepID=A0AAN9AD89_HALRR